MGFRNSVGIAQHIHRNVIRRALGDVVPPIGAQWEMRKDRPTSMAKDLYRIYLDNFDVITKADPETASLIEGQPGLMSLIARQAYSEANLPRHPKKSVCQQSKAEVQGAIVDGNLGIAFPKPPKVALYVSLALELVRRGNSTQREMQVVCGGFVYFCLFRRPLLSALNAVWKFIEDFSHLPPVVRLPMPPMVQLELVRFCGLVPLARMDFRLSCMGRVTASDASSTGEVPVCQLGWRLLVRLRLMRRCEVTYPSRMTWCRYCRLAYSMGLAASGSPVTWWGFLWRVILVLKNQRKAGGWLRPLSRGASLSRTLSWWMKRLCVPGLASSVRSDLYSWGRGLLTREFQVWMRTREGHSVMQGVPSSGMSPGLKSSCRRPSRGRKSSASWNLWPPWIGRTEKWWVRPLVKSLTKWTLVECPLRIGRACIGVTGSFWKWREWGLTEWSLLNGEITMR